MRHWILTGTFFTACSTSEPTKSVDSGAPESVDCAAAFQWESSADAPPSQVSIVGDFNGWEPGVDLLTEVRPGIWEGSVALPPGAHVYRIAETYEWSYDAVSTTTCDPLADYVHCPADYKEPWDTQWSHDCAPGSDSVCSSMVVVADCGVPTLDVAAFSVDRGSGRASLTVLGTPGLGSERMDTATVTLDGAPVVAAWTGSVLELALSDLDAGRHTIRITATDSMGRMSERLHIPFWTDVAGDEAFAAGAIYFAFVDRMADGDTSRNTSEGATAELGRYQGGDFQGVTDLIPYLDDLGVRTIWLSNPQDNAEGAYAGDCDATYAGYHAYWPDAARDVEEHFGDAEALHALVSAAHARGMRVIVDWVANHVHENHPYYAMHPEWFNDQAICRDSSGGQSNWDRIPESCWFAPYLPDIDYSHPDALATMVDDAIWWAKEFDLDGLRVDAVKHMPHSVPWNLESRIRNEIEFVDVGGDTNFWTVGETFDGTERIQAYISREGRPQLDGQFDFPLYYAVNAAFGDQSISLGDLESAVLGSLGNWGPDALMSSFLGNHDVMRFSSLAAEGWQASCVDGTLRIAAPVSNADVYARLRLAWTFLFTQPMVPLVYYGDELGMPGYTDPDNRQPLWWFAGDVSGGIVQSVEDLAGRLDADEAATVRHVGALGRARRSHPGLWRGDAVQWWIESDLWAYARVDPQTGDSSLVVINRGGSERWLTNGLSFAGLPADGTWEDVLTGDLFGASGDALTVSVPARGSRVLVLQ